MNDDDRDSVAALVEFSLGMSPVSGNGADPLSASSSYRAPSRPMLQPPRLLTGVPFTDPGVLVSVFPTLQFVPSPPFSQRDLSNVLTNAVDGTAGSLLPAAYGE